jgi:hypothetical protein
MIRVDFGPISETVYIDIIKQNHWKVRKIFFSVISLCPFNLHILHSLFDKMLYSVYVHSKNNIPILYGSI